MSAIIKNLLIFSVIILVSSCSGSAKKGGSSQVDQGQIVPVEEEVYQAIESEKQAEEINKETEAEIQEIEVQDRVFFDFDSYSLSNDAKKVLDTQVSWLKSDSKINVTVEGHCDERGTREYNIALGERRANSVKNYLAQNGVEESRIKVISYGKERPAFFGTGEKVWSKNRRSVTIVGQ
jgi:peptidoglycan-associated lipoprotein